MSQLTCPSSETHVAVRHCSSSYGFVAVAHAGVPSHSPVSEQVSLFVFGSVSSQSAPSKYVMSHPTVPFSATHVAVAHGSFSYGFAAVSHMKVPLHCPSSHSVSR